MQELGVRLPIYPTLPSISEINADQLLQHRRQPRGVVLPARHRDQRPDRRGTRASTTCSSAARWQRYTVEIRNQFRRAGHFQFAGSTTTGTGNTLADFLLGQLSQFDQGTGEYKDYVVNYGSLFVQDDFKASTSA